MCVQPPTANLLLSFFFLPPLTLRLGYLHIWDIFMIVWFEASLVGETHITIILAGWLMHAKYPRF